MFALFGHCALNSALETLSSVFCNVYSAFLLSAWHMFYGWPVCVYISLKYIG